MSSEKTKVRATISVSSLRAAVMALADQRPKYKQFISDCEQRIKDGWRIECKADRPEYWQEEFDKVQDAIDEIKAAIQAGEVI